MNGRGRCTGCGASIPADTGVCAYCGTEAEYEVDVPAAAKDRVSERIERFDRLTEHPSFDKWMRWRPQAVRPTNQRLAAGVVLVVVAVLLAFVQWSSETFRPLRAGPLVGAPVVLALWGAALWAIGAREVKDWESSVVRAYAALAVAKRSETWSSNERAGTTYFATLEFRTGTRREYEVDGDFYGLVVEDDIGIAYIREGDLESFKKVDV